MDLINAKTDQQRKIAMNQVNGTVSNMIKNIRSKITKIIYNFKCQSQKSEFKYQNQKKSTLF